MTRFYFVRHGKMDDSMEGKLFFRDFAINMQTLSEKGIAQIKDTAKDPRLQDADIIISSAYGRALHSAAILSKELNIDIKVEPELHEWVSDAKDYGWLPTETAKAYYQELIDNNGHHPEGQTPVWESAEMMKERVFRVLDKYKHLSKVIVVCHGTLMQFVLGIDHPDNGQVSEYDA